MSSSVWQGTPPPASRPADPGMLDTRTKSAWDPPSPARPTFAVRFLGSDADRASTGTSASKYEARNWSQMKEYRACLKANHPARVNIYAFGEHPDTDLLGRMCEYGGGDFCVGSVTNKLDPAHFKQWLEKNMAGQMSKVLWGCTCCKVEDTHAAGLGAELVRHHPRRMRHLVIPPHVARGVH